MQKWKVWLFLMILTLSSCATQTQRKVVGLSVSDVVVSPLKYDGQIITVSGWLSMRFEDFNLWETADAHAQWNIKKCISLKQRFKSEKDIDRVDGRFVAITGMFYKNANYENGQAVVRLGACSELAIAFGEVVDIEVLD